MFDVKKWGLNMKRYMPLYILGQKALLKNVATFARNERSFIIIRLLLFVADIGHFDRTRILKRTVKGEKGYRDKTALLCYSNNAVCQWRFEFGSDKATQ